MIDHLGWTTVGARSDDVDPATQALVLALDGPLDLSTADAVERRLGAGARAVSDGGVLIVDLAGVDFVDSTGLACLTRIARHLEVRGAGLVLRSPAPRVAQVLRLTRFDLVATAIVDAPAP